MSEYEWKVGDVAYGIEVGNGVWMYLPEPFEVDGVPAQPYRVVGPQPQAEG